MAIMRNLISSYVLLILSPNYFTANANGLDEPVSSNRRRQQICSCSPQQYIFQLSFNREPCAVNEIGQLSGITETECNTFHGGFTDSEFEFAADQSSESILGTYGIDTLLAGISWLDVADMELSKKEKKELIKLQRENEKQNAPRFKNAIGKSRKNVRRIQDHSSLIEVVYSARFTEVNSQGVIIQDTQVDFAPGLTDGSTLQFASVSSLLTAEVPLEVQQAFIPTDVVLFMEGLDKDDNLVLSRVAWRFGNECDGDAVVMEGGEGFGFVDFVSTNAVDFKCL
jgi:hypothetical protein